jgi:hypothetical protein
VATAEVLQWWRRLDLAESGELLMFRALRREVVEKVSKEVLPSPSQPFICEGRVPGVFSKLITDRIGLNKP